MADKYKAFAGGLESPATSGAAIAPSDTVDLAQTTRALYVGGFGNLKVTLAGGDTVTLNNVPEGALLPLRVRWVLATGTTATNLVGLS